MELFSEIYSSYYRAVEEMLDEAQIKPLNNGEIQKILSNRTFCESVLTMLPKLRDGDWPVMQKTETGYKAACNVLANNPLTALQKAWLKSILADPRILLFLDDAEVEELQQTFLDVEPLYRQEDFYLFDQALDSDDYSSKEYREHFRAFLSAIRQKTGLFIHYEGSKGKRVYGVYWPYKLEYSPKDDKFRAFCYKKNGRKEINCTLNLARVVSIEPMDTLAANYSATADENLKTQFRQVDIEITRERNALERCMVHFAHFEKRTEYDDKADKYICSIRYNVKDETEVVIRVLSFGPTIKVVGPDAFLKEIRDRVKKQTQLIRLDHEISF
jgi:hypothetical protein